MSAIIIPMIVMLLFCSLYAGAYIWMRRPKFGENDHDDRVAPDESQTSDVIDQTGSATGRTRH